MANAFWIAFTALCALGLAIMVPFLMIRIGEEGNK